MKIKTTTKHTIAVQESKLKKNLFTSFMQLLQDELDSAESEFDYFKMDLNRFHEEATSIEKNGYTQSFREGYTMMLLDSDDFEFVEKWFHKPKHEGEEELEIHIHNHLGDRIEVVHHSDLNF
jgi:hypothetical protein